MSSWSRLSPAASRVPISSLAALLDSGLSQSSVSRAARAGQLLRVGHGVYAAAAEPSGLDLASHYGTLSHTTAAEQLGLDLLGEPGLHVTRPHRLRSHPTGLTVHRSRLEPDQVAMIAGRRVTAPLRTLVDCCRLLPEPSAVVLIDSALRVGMADLAEVLALATQTLGPRSARLRRAAALADPLSGSALETLARLLFHRHGLRPTLQAVIRDRHGFIARVDFLFEDARIIVETDGYDHHSDRAAFRADRRRQNALVQAGYRVVRFSWDDVVHRPDYVIGSVRSLLAAG